MRRLLALLLLLPFLASAQVTTTPAATGVFNPAQYTGAYTGSSFTDTGLTAGRCTFAGTGGLLTDNAGALCGSGGFNGVIGAGTAAAATHTTVAITSAGSFASLPLYIADNQYGFYVAGGELNFKNGNDGVFNFINQGGTGTNLVISGTRVTVGGATTPTSSPYAWATTGGTTAVLVDANGDLFKQASARKYKEDFAAYKKGLPDVLKLQPMLYRLKTAKHAGPLQGGLIADDLDAMGMSEFVGYGPEGVDSINYGNMAALWVNAFKQIDSRLKKLEAKVARQQAEIKQLKAGAEKRALH